MKARLRRVLTAISIAGAFGALAATPAAGATLWDQFDNPGFNPTGSQNYEASLNQFDDEAADDVLVLSSEKWRVKGIEVDGSYFQGTGPATSVNVFFWRNSRGLPGTLVYAAPAVVPSAGLDTGDFVITLPTPAKLRGGGASGRKYWMSVQANLIFDPGGNQWGWQNRTVGFNNAAVWRNPGDGVGTGCTSFAPRATCSLGSGEPDQVFKLTGKAVPVLP